MHAITCCRSMQWRWLVLVLIIKLSLLYFLDLRVHAHTHYIHWLDSGHVMGPPGDLESHHHQTNVMVEYKGVTTANGNALCGFVCLRLMHDTCAKLSWIVICKLWIKVVLRKSNSH